MRAWIIDLAAAVSLAAPASLGQAAPASLRHLSTTSTTSTTSMTSAATARFFVTGYVLQGYTATGTYVHPGTCAVDPRVVPLGSYLTISGLGTCHAEDTGGAILGYRIDVWVPTVAQADALTGWYTASWGSGPTQPAPGSQASRRQSHVPAPKRAPPRQARSGRVLSQRWYSHGNAYVHRATRATARHIAAQRSCLLRSHQRKGCHSVH